MPFNNKKLVKEKPVRLGSKEWEKVWPEAVWPGELPATFPVAAFSYLRAEYNPQTENGNSHFDFNMPLLFTLVFGGAFDDDVSFFGEWSAYTAGVNARGLQRLFFQFNSLFGPDNVLNIRAGRFEPGITDGYTSTQKLTSAYQITIDYDPTDKWKPRDPQSGIEINGIIDHHFYYAGGVVNGEGKTLADARDQKDFYLRAAYQFGGNGFAGKDIDSSFQGEKIFQKYITVGFYSYFGSIDEITGSEGQIYSNTFRRYGTDVNLTLKDFEFLGGLILGWDENPFGNMNKLKSTAYFLEGDYNFYPWLIGIIRMEKGYSVLSGSDVDNFMNIVPNLTILYRANIRFSLEGYIKIYKDRKVDNRIIPAENNNPFQSVTLNTLIAF